MKRFILFSLMIGLFACAKVNTEPEYVSVNFKVTYEGLELVSESELTKAVEQNGIYGVAIKEYVNNNPELYCYGLFDDISQLQVNFKRGERYSIMIDYFPNGKNELVHNGNVYETTMSITPWHNAPSVVLNQIVYSTTHTVSEILFSYYQPYDRYGYVNYNYVPTDNSPLPVYFLRLNAGLTVKLETVEGFVFETVRMYGGYTAVTYTADIAGGADEIVIDKIALGWNGVDWSNGICDLYNVHYEIGTPDNPTMFFDGDIELKRNTMRTYTIKLESDMTTNAMSVSYEEAPYGADNGGYLN